MIFTSNHCSANQALWVQGCACPDGIDDSQNGAAALQAGIWIEEEGMMLDALHNEVHLFNS
jgi:hypothetical protein